MSEAVRAALSAVVEGRTLGRDEARAAMGAVMDGEATGAQLAALLVALRMRGETTDELAGFAEAMRARVTRVDAPAGTVDTLVKPENKATLTKILTYHVVPGKLEASGLTDGKKLKTVEGEELTVRKADGKVMIVDAKGGTSTVTIPNVNQSNGVIHVIDTVLMPAS